MVEIWSAIPCGAGVCTYIFPAYLAFEENRYSFTFTLQRARSKTESGRGRDEELGRCRIYKICPVLIASSKELRFTRAARKEVTSIIKSTGCPLAYMYNRSQIYPIRTRPVDSTERHGSRRGMCPHRRFLDNALTKKIIGAERASRRSG